MTSQPDKLFRDALENFQRPAPVDAWEKIDANLNKSGNKGLWLKIAAGLLLLCVTGFFLLPKENDEEATIASVKENEQRKTVQKNNPDELVASEKTVDQPKEIKNTPVKKSAPKKQDLTRVAESIESSNESIVASVTTELQSESVAEINSTTSQSSRTIVYTADEVNSKYLKKKSSTEATPETKKSSGIQKLMGLAYELKNTDNGLGDLRQKKNEILALNFLNEDKTTKEKN